MFVLLALVVSLDVTRWTCGQEQLEYATNVRNNNAGLDFSGDFRIETVFCNLLTRGQKY